jgi:hypothetical protein
MQKYLKENGYGEFIAEKFSIKIDLPRPANGERGTYTVKTEWDDRTMFSGPVHLPWYFILTKKTK